MLISFQQSRFFGKRAVCAGFTLIEMLVVAAIIMILTAVFLFQQSRFDSATILRSLAYSTALSVRQAQVYGTSVLGTGASDTAFAPAYGVHFSATDNDYYTLFADQAPANNRYDVGEEIKVFSLGNNYRISKLCARLASNYHCSPGDSAVGSLQILFKRPNPDAQFLLLNAGGSAFPGELYASAYIQIRSNEGTYRNVLVYATGQVSVLAPNTDPI